MTTESSSSRSDSVEDAVESLTEYAATLNLPDQVAMTAEQLYEQTYKNELYHGRPREAMLGAILHLAARANDSGRNPSIIADTVGSDRESILDAARHLSKRLDIGIRPPSAKPYVRQFCADLETSDEVQQLALDIIDANIDAGQHSGKRPTGFAAAAIYAAVTERDASPTQQAIADVADVSTVTIRNRYDDQLAVYKDQTS